MSLDFNRATFVAQEYRYQTVSDDDIKAVQPNAQSLELDTWVADEFGVDQLADEVFDLSSSFQRLFTVTLTGTDDITLDDFDGSPPTFVCDFPDYATSPSEKYLPVEFSLDFATGVTTLTLKG